MQRTVSARIPTATGEFWLYHYRNQRDHKEHLALVMGEVNGQEDVLVRVHSECFTGDVLGSRRCDCGEQLQLAMEMIADEGRGVILYLRQEGRGIGLEEKLKAYNLQDAGYDTVEANLLLGHQADERQYWAASGILADLGIRSIRLLTNNPDKIEKLSKDGIRINGSVRLIPHIYADNIDYLSTKVEKMRHMLALPLLHANGHSNGHGQSNGHSNGILPNSSHEHTPIENQLAQVEQQLAALQQRIAAHSGELPFVTLTWAQSLDGSIAGENGEPLRLSSDGAMRITHRLRAMHDAILVGVGTVLADDPRLTTRLVEGPSPRPVIVDSQLRTPTNAALFSHPKSAIFAVTQPSAAAQAAIRTAGGEILHIPADSAGRVDLTALLQQLGKLGIHSVMVEGGAQILNSFFEKKLGNALLITIAPRLIGGTRIAKSAAVLPESAQFDYTQVDRDMLVWGRL